MTLKEQDQTTKLAFSMTITEEICRGMVKQAWKKSKRLIGPENVKVTTYMNEKMAFTMHNAISH